jgi:two-component system response regulator YesN
MSRSYFCQCFRKVTGQSFGTYLGGLRLDRAKALLLAGSKPIGRIADECGFRDRRYFSRIFRAATGFLPTEYRSSGGPKV